MENVTTQASIIANDLPPPLRRQQRCLDLHQLNQDLRHTTMPAMREVIVISDNEDTEVDEPTQELILSTQEDDVPLSSALVSCCSLRVLPFDVYVVSQC